MVSSTISLSGGKVAPTGGLTVTFTVTGTATNGTDYGTISTTALIPAGQSSVTVPIALINDDNIVEGNESVVLTLSSISPNPGAQVTVDNSPAVVTIGDNDATTVSVAANDPTATETTGNDGEFTISLSDGKVAPTGGLTVTFTVTGTATNGTDYGTISTTALIPAGQSSVTVPVASINDDNIVKGTSQLCLR